MRTRDLEISLPNPESQMHRSGSVCKVPSARKITTVSAQSHVSMKSCYDCGAATSTPLPPPPSPPLDVTVQLDAMQFLTYSLSYDTMSPCCSPSVTTNCFAMCEYTSPPASRVPPAPVASVFSFAIIVFRVVRHRVSGIKQLLTENQKQPKKQIKIRWEKRFCKQNIFVFPNSVRF